MNLLVLCPHVDDEILAAGTIAKKAAQGWNIKIIALSSCEASLPEGFTKDNVVKEFQQSCKNLGAAATAVNLFPVRNFPEHRQEILDYFLLLKKSQKPDLVFVPTSADIHQDHQVVHNEALRAFRFSSIWGYEFPYNTFNFSTDIFVNVHDFVSVKIHSMECYASQKHRDYMNRGSIIQLLKVRGGQAGFRHAEAFEAIRIREA